MCIWYVSQDPLDHRLRLFVIQSVRFTKSRLEITFSKRTVELSSIDQPWFDACYQVKNVTCKAWEIFATYSVKLPELNISGDDRQISVIMVFFKSNQIQQLVYSEDHFILNIEHLSSSTLKERNLSLKKAIFLRPKNQNFYFILLVVRIALRNTYHVLKLLNVLFYNPF